VWDATRAVDGNITPLSLAKENRRRLKVMSAEDREAVWRSKELHGRFYKTRQGLM
jgi:hypothetical protein